MTMKLDTVNTLSARKDDSGKTDLTFLTDLGLALNAVCNVLEGGFKKYGERGGWLKVPNGPQRYQAAMLRHALYYPSLGETVDQELSNITGKLILHKACVAVNALFDLELELRRLNDLADSNMVKIHYDF